VEDIIDIKSSKEEPANSENSPDRLDNDHPIAAAVNAIVEASEKLLSTVLSKGDVTSANKEVLGRAIDLALEVVKRRKDKDDETPDQK
jgi:hypothetical protein